MLRLDELSYRLPGMEFHFTLQLARGEILVLLGPSGAGKSTLLSLLAGFLTPSGGALNLDGQDLLALPPARRPFTSLFQSNNLFLHLTVYQNIALGLDPGLHLTPAQRQRVVAAARRLGIGDYLERRPGQLSGGQQQRVALARCLVRQQPFLLLDEPFSALDPALRREMLAEVRQLAREQRIGVLLISHHPEDARLIADRLAFLDQGRIQFVAGLEALEQPPTDGMARYLGRAMPDADEEDVPG